MRSLILVLALAAPCAAFASAPRDFAIPIFHTTDQTRPQYVRLSFRNSTAQHRTLEIGTQTFDMAPGSTLSLSMREGSTVRVSSDQNSKVSGIVLRASRDLSNQRINLQ